MDKTLKFAVDRMELIDEVNQSQFAEVKIYAFASGENSHERPVSEEALKRSANTIYDKPLVYYYDKYTDDAGGHDPLEVPCGFVHRENNPIEYVQLDDGRLMLSVEAMIWKRYSGQILSLFERDGLEKPVSVEIQIIDEEENEQGELEILDFCYMAITILGTYVKPAIESAKAEILAFSSAKQEYEDSLNFQIPSIVKQNAQKGLILKKTNSKGATAVNMSIAQQLISNESASLELIQNIYKFSQKAKTDTARYLLGNVEAFEWVDNILNLDDKEVIKQLSSDLGTEDSIKANKSKEALSDSSWGDVDKSSLREKILKAKNYKTLINDVYMLIESGWENAPSEHLKYPVMQITDGELVYNKGGLSSALAYAEKEGETGVVSKVNKIRKKLGLEDNKDGEKMSKKETLEKFSMTSNEIMDLMNQCVHQVKYQSGDDECSKYWVSDYDDTYMYCYDSEIGGSVAIPYQYIDENIKADFENIKPARMAWVVDDNEPDENYKPMMMAIAKAMMAKEGFTSDENTLADAQAKMNEKEAEYNQKIAKMEANVTQMTEKMTAMEEQMSVYMTENTSLKEEKMARLEQEKLSAIEFTLQEVSDSMPKEKMEELREDAKNFSAEDLNVWVNKVKAEAFTFSKDKNNDSHIKVGLSWLDNPDKSKKGLWD